MDRQDEHVDHLIDAYVLGALEPDEVALVERHLQMCDACQALLNQARVVSEGLLLAAPDATPPPGLRNSIISRIRQEASGQQPAPSSAHQAGAPETDPARQGRMGRILRSLFGGDSPEIHDSAADALLRDLLLDPAVIIRPIAATEHTGRPAASFVGTRARHEGIVLAHGLRPLDAAHAYQVWLLRGDQRLPNVLFSVDHSGRGIGIVRATEALLDFDVLAISPEPAGGSPGPTGNIVLAGTLRAE
jgi:anti-sigma-K factor RskA